MNSRTPNSTLRALVIGGTGAIGSQLIKQLRNSPKFSQITSITRRLVEYDEMSDKIEQKVVNMDDLPSTELKGHFDVSFCCLGTTIADAKTEAAFRLVDYDYVRMFAELSKKYGIRQFHVLSSTGANKDSWFLYMRTKGEMEEMLKSMKFPITGIFRPGLLDRGEKTRLKERITGWFLSSIKVETVAEAMRLNAEKFHDSPPTSEVPICEIYENQHIFSIVSSSKDEL